MTNSPARTVKTPGFAATVVAGVALVLVSTLALPVAASDGERRPVSSQAGAPDRTVSLGWVGSANGLPAEAGVSKTQQVVLYDQTDLQSDAGAAAQNFEASQDLFDCEGADDFVVDATGGWVVEEVFLAGSYTLEPPGGPARSVNIVFYSNSPETGPSTPVCSSTGTILDDNSGSLLVRLGNPCTLSSGRHWLGAQVNMDFDPYGQWYWAASPEQVGRAGRWRNPRGGFGSCSDWGTVTGCTNLEVEIDYLFRLVGQTAGPGPGEELPTDGTWTQFTWNNGPGVFNSEGPFTFTAPTAGTLDVTDAFIAGDRFEVYDSGQLIGTTSTPGTGGGDDDFDPNLTFLDPRWSSGSFSLGAGAHSITIKTTQVPPNAPGGGAFLRWNGGSGGDVEGGQEQQATPPGTDVGTKIASATDIRGNRVIVWKQNPSKRITPEGVEITQSAGIFGRTFDPDDNPAGVFEVDTSAGEGVTDPTVSFDSSGRFVVGWEKTAGTGGIFGRTFGADSQPQGGSFPVSDDPGVIPQSPSVATNFAGEFVMAWRQGGGKLLRASDGIFGRTFQPDGTPGGASFRVDGAGTAVEEISTPAVSADAAGRFLVTWHQRAPGKTAQSGDGIFGRYFDPAGQSEGGAFTVNDLPGGDPADPGVGVDSQGGSVVVWQQDVGGDAGVVICARLFDRSGQAVDTQFLVNSETAGTQFNPSVAVNEGGDFAVVWESTSAKNGTGIFGRFFTNDGQPIGDEFEVASEDSSGLPSAPEVSIAGDDSFTVAYTKSSGGSKGVFYRTFEVSTAPGTCAGDSTTLCLNSERFQIDVSWRDFSNNTGVGRAEPLTNDTGYFWFFNDANVELVIKVLDARGINGYFWIFYGALSNIEYTITVTDTVTGSSRSYFNQAGAFASVGDTSALPGDGKAIHEHTVVRVDDTGGGHDYLLTRDQVWTELVGHSESFANCIPGTTNLCLNSNRFRVDVSWQDFGGATGVGQASPLSGDTGTFWFFDSTNIELIIKVLDGRSINQHFWVFYGALSNVQYTITVTDTDTGQSKIYTNPLGTFGSVGDTSAFFVP